MASSIGPGGGWIKGKMAQEEDLFRRSNLCLTLLPVLYEIPEYGALLSTDVSVFRGTVAEGYPLLAEPYKVDVFSAAAYDHNLVPALLKQDNPADSRDFSFQDPYIAKTARKLVTYVPLVLLLHLSLNIWCLPKIFVDSRELTSLPPSLLLVANLASTTLVSPFLALFSAERFFFFSLLASTVLTWLF